MKEHLIVVLSIFVIGLSLLLTGIKNQDQMMQISGTIMSCLSPLVFVLQQKKTSDKQNVGDVKEKK